VGFGDLDNFFVFKTFHIKKKWPRIPGRSDSSRRLASRFKGSRVTVFNMIFDIGYEFFTENTNDKKESLFFHSTPWPLDPYDLVC
jgi:hypothetical protein